MEKTGKQRILIADDDAGMVTLLLKLCKQWHYDTMVANNGREALEKADAFNPDLILMDVNMPIMDGLETTRLLKSQERTEHIPIIILTAQATIEGRITGITEGASDYLEKPFNFEELGMRIRNNLKIKEYNDFLTVFNTTLEKQVAEKTRQLQETMEKLGSSRDMIKRSYSETIHRLALAIEFRGEYTGRPVERTGAYAKLIAEELDLGDDFAEAIFYAAPLHDIGKIAIPDAILHKHGKLTPDECLVMQSHALIGAQMLSGSDSVFLQMAEKIARSHHERWDGSGYPDGLKGEEIPIAARIVSIVDQYDSLRSKKGHASVIQIITGGNADTLPSHFDPSVLEAFIRLERQFEQVGTQAGTEVLSGTPDRHEGDQR